MTSKQELRDEVERVAKSRDAWRQKYVVADGVIRDLNNELQATRADLAAARARVAELEAAVTTPEPRQWCASHGLRCDYTSPGFCDTRDEAATTPEPRPFRVGDRVRVAHKATFMGEFGRATRSFVGGHTGVIGAVAPDGDLYVDVPAGDLGGHVSPEFCTLVEDEPNSAHSVRGDTPPGLTVTTDGTLLNWEGVNYVRQPEPDLAPEPVTLTLPDGTTVTFDAVVVR